MDAELEDELLVPPYRLQHSQRTARPEDADAELAQDSPDDPRFLRSKSRVPVRRRQPPRSQWRRRLWGALLVLVVVGVAALLWGVRGFLHHDARFVLQTSAAIELQGNQIVTRPDVVRIFTSDIGQSIFTVPLAARKAKLETLPWVRSATVMRLWPNRLRVSIVERTPVAYVRDGNAIRLVDADGRLLEMPPGGLQQNSFPVVTGIAAGIATSVPGGDMTPALAAKARAAKIQLYLQFMAALDAGGGQLSQSISEVGVSDSEDIRAIVAIGSSEILVHFGDSDFLARYQAFAAHREEWLRMYPHLASVDMRYGRQVVLDMAPGYASNSDASNTNSSTTATTSESETTTEPPMKPMKAIKTTSPASKSTATRKAGH